jgi:probable HAF family extracellular repeat protein
MRQYLSQHRLQPAILIATATLAATRAPAQNFTGLGVLPGMTNSRATAVSEDGETVVGTSSSPSYLAFRWTVTGGMESLGAFLGYGSEATAVGANGSFVVVNVNTWFAFTWTEPTGLVGLGSLPGFGTANGTAVSADGSVVTGASGYPSPTAFHAFRWTQSGMVDLGTFPGNHYSYAFGMNADGSVIVGSAYTAADALRHSFRWTAPTGLVDLGTLPGTPTSRATAVNADGTVIVGNCDAPSGEVTYRWTSSTGMTPLGSLAGATTSFPYAVSADGTVVAGSSGGRAFIWTAALGMVDLNDFLPAHGVDLSGWTLGSVTGMSADRRVLVGTGGHDGITEAWRAELPPGALCGSSDFNHDGDAGTDPDIESFFACLAGHCCPTCDSADFNADGDSGTDADIESFFRVLAGGPC